MQRNDTSTYDNGTQATNLEPLLQRLRLPWQYRVLAACMDPDDRGRNHVLVQKMETASPQEYVVYRVDGADGSCHGGHYCGDLDAALDSFSQSLSEMHRAVADRLLDARLASGELSLGQSAHELPAPDARSELYADRPWIVSDSPAAGVRINGKPATAEQAGEFSRKIVAPADSPQPASLSAASPSSEDRALLARVAAFMEDDGSISDGERHELLQDVLERAGGE